MSQKIVDLQEVMAMNNHYFVKKIGECFADLNALLKSKSGATHDPLFIREEGSMIKLGYVIQNKEQGKTYFFSDETIQPDWGAEERACMVQFVIFEGCKHYGCYDEVPMRGAPEDGNASFSFTHEGTEYQYQLWK